MPARLTCLLLAALLILHETVYAGGGSFNANIRPILQNKCFACHGPDKNARKADLRLDLREAALEVLAPGDPDSSAVLHRIREREVEDRMPPAETHKSISEEELATLTQWISEGAAYQDHWAFIPPMRPDLPALAGAGHPIDSFIAARLKQAGLEMSRPADKATLIRRVSLDLTGLPPSAREVEAFVQSTEPDAYERLVDRLLASPAYGEHMAATWLETSRYADTDGYQNDRYRYHWAWRDWVIDAFNRNLPYDQFVVDQLAGDLRPDATLHQQIATGFCRNHRINSEAGSIPKEWHTEYVADRVEMLGTAFLGLTLGCARCHDHKYDPISQKEYYQLFAFFNNVPEFGTGPNNGNSPPFISVPEDWPLIPTDTTASVPPAIEWQKNTQNDGAIKRPVPGDESTLMVMAELPEPRATYILKRGQYDRPDLTKPVQPTLPANIGTGATVDGGTRLDLARSLTAPDHPLTARVAVNRYWQHFFGRGIVATSENLGVQGELPSHPGLLDWLASEFVESGWDVKAIQKSMVMSATYQQASEEIRPGLLAKDPDNRLLSRASRLRLPAFVIRDQALSISGLLVHQLHGKPAKPYMPDKIWSAISNNRYDRDNGANLYRRSIYTYWRRTIPPPMMMTLNAGDREVCTVRQVRTNTPLQALSLLNNVAFLEASRLLAQSVMRNNEDPSAAIAQAHERAFGVSPSAETLGRLRPDFDAYRDHFQKHPADAAALLKTGEYPIDSTLAQADLAAMTLVASTLFNFDQLLTRE
ncbi:MAG: PSD1 domain-containing protein [Verrucomicrobiae bacterium]|nr:PSD1 domain-containing protein [Verrucomicrobiae bacterium]